MVFAFDDYEGPVTNGASSDRPRQPQAQPAAQPKASSWAQMANKQQAHAGKKEAVVPAARAASKPAPAEAFPALGSRSAAPIAQKKAVTAEDFPRLGNAKAAVPAQKQPLPIKGGLSAIFASESRNVSRAGSRVCSDAEGPAPKVDLAAAPEKKKKKKAQKGKTSNATALLGNSNNAPGLRPLNQRSTTTTSLNTKSAQASRPKMDREILSFAERRQISYSGQTSSASSDLEDSEVPASVYASEASSAGTTPVRQGMLGQPLEASGATYGDLVTVTSEDGLDVETYEVALDHDFISGDVWSRPITRAGSKERATSSSRTASALSTPPRLIAPMPGLAASRSRPSTPQISTKQSVCAADFEVLRCLGKGSYGTVLLVRHIRTGKLYAQKQLKKASLITTKKLVEQTLTERQILEAVRHPFVVKLYYAFQDHQKLYLILEYAEGGELFLHLATERIFPEQTAAFYMASLVLALSHLHTNAGVVYRDLKPENCLLDREGYLLLTDFGLSKVATEESACRSWVGTVEYMAPEIILGKEYDEKVDWWSLGALGVDLLTGKPPFPGNNRAKVQDNIIKAKLALPYYLSQDAKDILGKLLQKNPEKRWGVNDLERMKKHRFFRRVDWKSLERREVAGGPPIQPLVTDPEAAENFSTEFTELPCSPPVESRMGGVRMGGIASGISKTPVTGMHIVKQREVGAEEEELFGGFSFVGSYGLAAEMAHWEQSNMGNMAEW